MSAGYAVCRFDCGVKANDTPESTEFPGGFADPTDFFKARPAHGSLGVGNTARDGTSRAGS